MRISDWSSDVCSSDLLTNAREMVPSQAVPAEVWEKFLSIPSEALPQRVAKPVKRLTALAHELAADGLLPRAGKLAHEELHKALDAAQIRFRDGIAAARGNVLSTEEDPSEIQPPM